MITPFTSSLYNLNIASEILNEDLVNVQNWDDQWLVKFSPGKTKLVTSSFKEKAYSDIKFNNATLASVETHTHLSLTLSINLSWTEHIKCTINSVSSTPDVLKGFKI